MNLKSIDRLGLFMAMVCKTRVVYKRVGDREYTGLISSIEMEDGSGFLFNVRIHPTDNYMPMETVFVRTKLT